jgi:hypothetical protein
VFFLHNIENRLYGEVLPDYVSLCSGINTQMTGKIVSKFDMGNFYWKLAADTNFRPY